MADNFSDNSYDSRYSINPLKEFYNSQLNGMLVTDKSNTELASIGQTYNEFCLTQEETTVLGHLNNVDQETDSNYESVSSIGDSPGGLAITHPILSHALKSHYNNSKEPCTEACTEESWESRSKFPQVDIVASIHKENTTCNIEKKHECTVCGRHFLFKCVLKRHMNFHTGETKYICDICGKISYDMYELRKHKKIHLAVKPFKCEVCEKRFTNKTDRKKHMRRHTGEKPYNCAVCGKDFKDLSNFRRHTMIHTGDRPFVCQECGKDFICRSNLRKHMEVHTSNKQFFCEICGKSFPQRNQLKAHTEKHVELKEFKCQLCDKTFSRKGSLTVHVRNHSGEKPYECDICSKPFKTKGQVAEHMRGVHSGVRPYKCGICNKDFPTKPRLNDHLWTHESNKPFTCECGKSYSHSHKLVAHQKSHSKSAPLPCDICGSLYSTKSSLCRHKRTHEGEKPYSCFHCSKAFARKEHLNRHMERIHFQTSGTDGLKSSCGDSEQIANANGVTMNSTEQEDVDNSVFQHFMQLGQSAIELYVQSAASSNNDCI